MRVRLAAVAALAAIAAAALPSSAGVALVIDDPAGDANFSGLHGGTVPAGSQAGLDITKVTFDTTVKDGNPSAVKIDLTMSAAPSTLPTSSYGIIATHSVCGQLRLQIYYSESGPTTYGDLAACGANDDPTSTNAEQFAIDFEPKIEGNILRLQIPFKSLPKEFKVGSIVSEISAYTSTAEFVLAGYQPTDFEPSAGVDTVITDKSWKIS